VVFNKLIFIMDQEEFKIEIERESKESKSFA